MTLKYLIQNFIFLIVFFWNGLIWADEPALNINEALALSLSHPTIQAKKNEYQGAFHRLETSKWQKFPAVSAYSSPGQSTLASGNRESVTTLRVDQPIWSGGRIMNGIDSANFRLSAAEYAIIEVEQDILIKTATAFTNVLKLEARVKFSKENVDEHLRLVQLIERRARSELSSLAEVILAKARYDQVKSESIQLQTALINAKSDLQYLTGQKIDQIETPKIALSISNTLDDCLALAKSFSPTIKRLQAESSATESDIAVARANFLPHLSLRSDQIFGGILEGNATYLALTYQPGNGLSSLSSSREAASKKDVIESQLSTVTLEIINKVRNDWTQYFSELKQMEVYFNLSEMSRGVYQSYLRQYDAGKKTWVEVLNSRREATQANYTYIDSQWNNFIAGIRLEILMGTINVSNTALN
jgi:adhesin transport system outer membrane protein